MSKARRVVIVAFDGIQTLDVVGPPRCSSRLACWPTTPTRSSSRAPRTTVTGHQRPETPDRLHLQEHPRPDRHADRGRWRRHGDGAQRSRADRVDQVTGQALPPGDLRVQRRLPPCPGRAARRPPGHHPLGRVRPAPAPSPRGRGRPRLRSSSATAMSGPRPASPRAWIWRWPWSRRTWAATIALQTARWLVLYVQRPGGQAQFSAQLAAQLSENEPIREVQAWVAEHTDDDLTRRGAGGPRRDEHPQLRTRLPRARWA